MNKIQFKIKNSLLAYKFWQGYKKNKIEYPAILAHMDKTYGKPVFVESFNNLDNWKATDKTEWGSAVPGNQCTFVKENVSVRQNKGYNSLVISSTPEKATGRSWQGEEITRPISSGLVTGKILVRPGQVVSATVNTGQSYPGSWFSFWLVKKHVPGDERYREIDIFEKFMERKHQKKYTISIHGGLEVSHEMMNFGYPMFFTDEERLTFTCELYQHKVKIFVNGIHMFLAEEPDFIGDYYVIFDDAPSNHDGKVKTEDIIKILPKTYEIIDFRIYEM
jgi:hypothetical protein